jgi:hypothetical protein
MHLHDDPPRASSVVSGVPVQLDEVLLAMLAKEPDQRPTLATVRSVMEALRSGAADLAMMPAAKTAVASTSTRGAKKAPWLAIGAAVAILGGGIAVFAMGGGGAKKETAATAEMQPQPQPEPQPQPQPQPQPEPPPVELKPAGIVSGLKVRIDVHDASLEIDGRRVQVPPFGGIVKETLPPGDYKLVISAPGYHDELVEVTIESGETLDISPKLDKKKSSRPGGTKPPVTGSKDPKGSGSGSAPPPDNSDVVVNPFKKTP